MERSRATCNDCDMVDATQEPDLLTTPCLVIDDRLEHKFFPQ